jgi:lipopolysaccharide biosynthesis glycosyltransferase
MKTAFVLACDDKYIPYTTAVARRIAALASEKFPIIVISDAVSDENKSLAQKSCPEISFIEASHLFRDRTFYFHGPFSRACYLRLLFGEILADFDRVTYLDSDVWPLVDVAPLLAIRPKVAPIIAAYDLAMFTIEPPRDRLLLSEGCAYFNSGVMVMDLKAMREERVFDDALAFALEKPDLCLLVEQDALNVALDGRWQVLDWRWNAFTFMLDALPKSPFVRHCVYNKPWNPLKYGNEPWLIEMWKSALAEGPWPEAFKPEIPDRRDGFVRKTFVRAENAMKTVLYANSPGKRGERIRFRKQFPAILRAIEIEAGHELLASRFPETKLAVRQRAQETA